MRVIDIQEKIDSIGVGVNCYECKHRGGVAGSAHSSCSVIPDDKQLTFAMLAFQGLTPCYEVTVGDTKYSTSWIRANTHGVKSGWFNWPMDFDPTWLEKCVLFKSKEEVENES